MLGKLYITANSSTEKLKKATELVTQAIDDKIATDAASRNALNKLHLALSKAMGESRKSKKGIEDNLVPLEGGRTTIEEQGVEESILANENDLKVESVEEEGVMEAKDSLLDELLTDEEDL